MSGNRSSSSGCVDQPDPDAIKMFVGQIPRSMDENDLRKMFEQYGQVYQINVLRDKITGQSKGNGLLAHFELKHFVHLLTGFFCHHSKSSLVRNASGTRRGRVAGVGGGGGLSCESGSLRRATR